MALSCTSGVRECGGCLWCQGEPAWPEEREEPVIRPSSPKGEGPVQRAQELGRALKRLDALHGELERAARSLETLAEESTRATSRLSHMRYQSGTPQSRVEHAVIAGVDLEREIQELRAEKEALLAWIEPLAAALPAGTRRAIVRLRFAEGMSCVMIALRLHYSRSYVYKELAEGIRRMATESACEGSFGFGTRPAEGPQSRP